MVSIKEYKLIRNKFNNKYHVSCQERIVCPVCGGIELKVIGSRNRKVLKSDGESITLVIRRLRCNSCNRIHHELPDIIVPYKRYSSQGIEAIVDGKEEEVSCEESTIYRIRKWFREYREYLAGCLGSVAAQLGFKTIPNMPSAFQRIKAYVGKEAGWLARAVRTIANTNNWVHTRSAFLA